MKRAVLVNGVPASGKSSVARALADRTGWPLFAVDTIKEPFFKELAPVDRALNRRLGHAAYAAIFDTIAAFPDGQTVIIDAWFGFQPTAVLTGHAERAGLQSLAEIWCHAAPEVVGARYAARVPHRPKEHPGLEYVPELIALTERARPLDVGPRLTIDATLPLDIAAIVAFLRQTGFPVT